MYADARGDLWYPDGRTWSPAPDWGPIATGLGDPNAAPPASSWAGLLLLLASTVLNVVLGVTGAVMAHRGRWWRLPIGLHPVRGVLGRGETPPDDIGR